MEKGVGLKFYKILPSPGFEKGPHGWKSEHLTTELRTLESNDFNLNIKRLRFFFFDWNKIHEGYLYSHKGLEFN